MSDIIEQVRNWLEVFAEGDFDAYPGGVAEDFVLRLPFVPPGVPTEFRGRDFASKALAESAKGRSRLIFSNKVMRRTDDPELVVTTADAEAVMANGNPYRNSYVIFTRIRDGVVLEHIEYLNPLAILEAAQPPSGTE